jgi:hypothetical protein
MYTIFQVPKEETVPVKILKAKKKLLTGLSELHRANAHQLMRYCRYKEFRNVQRHLLELEEERFVVAVNREYRTINYPLVYTLGDRGYSHLRISGRFRRERAQDEDYLNHTLGVNEILISASKVGGWIELDDHVHEIEFNRKPMPVAIPERKASYRLMPDLYLSFRETTGHQQRFFVELQLSKLDELRWREKVRAYLHCMEAYHRRFDTAILTGVVVIVSSKHDLPRGLSPRLSIEQMQREQETLMRWQKKFMRWTERELIAQNKQDEADLFLFTTAILSRLTPESFEKPYFVTLARSIPQPLLHREEGL